MEVKLNCIEYNELLAFIKSVDKDFINPISNRIAISTFTEKIHNNALLFSLENNNDIIGFAACYANDLANKEAYIPFFAIRKEYQGTGKGLKLLDFIIQEITVNSIMDNILLHSDNPKAIKLYEKRGFISIEDNNGRKKMKLQIKR